MARYELTADGFLDTKSTGLCRQLTSYEVLELLNAHDGMITRAKEIIDSVYHPYTKESLCGNCSDWEDAIKAVLNGGTK